MSSLLPATWLGWLAMCALAVLGYLLWRLLFRMVGDVAGLGRPATAEEVVLWGLGMENPVGIFGGRSIQTIEDGQEGEEVEP